MLVTVNLELATKILFFLDRSNEKKSLELIGNARKFVENREETLDNYLKETKQKTIQTQTHPK